MFQLIRELFEHWNFWVYWLLSSFVAFLFGHSNIVCTFIVSAFMRTFRASISNGFCNKNKTKTKNCFEIHSYCFSPLPFCLLFFGCGINRFFLVFNFSSVACEIWCDFPYSAADVPNMPRPNLFLCVYWFFF